MVSLGGPSDGIRTHGLLVPNQARYQLRYTRMLPEQRIYYKEKNRVCQGEGETLFRFFHMYIMV